MGMISAWPTLVATMIAIIPVSLLGELLLAQTPAPPRSPSHIVIPFLANATKPTGLDFEGAECDLDASGDRMTCAFQQVFLTTSPVVADTCLITTNSYDRVCRRESATRW